MELKNELNELKHKQEVLKYFKLFGVDKDINHIIGNDLVTFKFETHKDFIRVFELLKPEFLDLYKLSNGCTSFEGINKNQVIEGSEKITLIKSKFLIELRTDKFEEIIKFKAEISYKKRIMDLWFEIPLNLFDKSFFHYKQEVDMYETDIAKKYNPKHKEVMLNRIMLNGFIESVLFYGGISVFYAVNSAQVDYMNRVLNNEVN